MALAYSYMRFSSPQQAEGDSIRRQTDDRDAWLTANPDVKLDTKLRMTDAGRSAYDRKNPDTYALAQFIEEIKAGRVKPGSYLLVENLDRLTREETIPALNLFTSILMTGVRIVQLDPETVYTDKSDAMDVMRAILEMSRGHSESKVKSNRGRKVWAEKQKNASQKIVTKRLPGWIVESDGKLVLDAPKAEIVRRIFRMCIEGQGCFNIAKALNDEGVPVLARTTFRGRAIVWADATVRQIIMSPATIGTYIPFRRHAKKAALAPVPNYFPPLIDEKTYLAAQGAIARRAIVGRGRRGSHVNLFAGLLFDVKSKSTVTYRHLKGRTTYIVPMGAIQGRGADWTSFPADEFEAGILAQLRELSDKDIQDETDPANKVETLRGRLNDVEALIEAWKAKMDNPAIVEIVATKLAELNTTRKTLAAEYETAKEEAASPLSHAMGELRTLADVLARDNSDETRTRVRAALRRAISRVRVVLGQRGAYRVAVVRIEFAGSGRAREYIMVHTLGKPLFVRSHAGPITGTMVVDWDELLRQFLEAQS